MPSPEPSDVSQAAAGRLARCGDRPDDRVAFEVGISLESIVQRARPKGVASGTPVPVTFITHATPERAIREAIAAVVTDSHIAEKPQVIRIERE